MDKVYKQEQEEFEEEYNSGGFARFVKLIFLTLIILLFYWCIKPVFSDECCWICTTRVTDYKPQPGIAKVSALITYSDSMFCDCTYVYIQAWEISNSDTMYINGMRREQISKCKQ
jgi:hypothetical protein